jgi:integrase
MPHFYQLPSGNFRWIVQYQGQRRDGTAPTRGEAILAGSQAVIELGGYRPTRIDLTVGELLDAYRHEKAGVWSPTYADDMATVLARLPATFTDRHVAHVGPPIVAALERQLTRDGWSAHRIHRVHNAVSGAFRLAVAYGWAHENPARDLSPPTFDKPDVNPPAHDVVHRILDASPDRLRLFLRLAAITGARLGELVALRWDDYHGDVLTIRRAAIYTPGTGLVVREQTKTGRKGDRRLELDAGTVQLVDVHRSEQAGRASAHNLPAPVYIFSHDAGITPWRPGYAGLEYRRIRAKVPGAERVRFHDLRHYVATTMLLDGENPLDVAAQLGHTNPATTLRVYAHYLPGRGGESAAKRAGRLNG